MTVSVGAHKVNPSENAKTYRTRTWRKKAEGLLIDCTAKGRKEGTGRKMAKFFVAIAYGKGVIKCEPYEGHVNGAMFSEFIRTHFNDMFRKSANPEGKLFLQDGDPSQNSALAHLAIDFVGGKLFQIPARSPDLNPIENIFHIVSKQLHNDAQQKNITKESFEQFQRRVCFTLENVSGETIDKTIESMGRRINLVIESKGIRTKY